MADIKPVFIAFAIEDKAMRDLLTGQSRHSGTPFEYVDMSVKEPYPQAEWKDRVRTRIRRSRGVIVLVSRSSLTSTGQLWEIECAQAEGKPMIGIWPYPNDRTYLAAVYTVEWTWANLQAFIDRL